MICLYFDLAGFLRSPSGSSLSTDNICLAVIRYNKKNESKHKMSTFQS